MYKLILIFHDHPALPDLTPRWTREFVPLAERLPGLRRVVVSHVDGGPTGQTEYRLIHELLFEDKTALTEAMQSPEGVAAGQCLVRINKDAPGGVTMLFAEHLEDTPRPDASSAPPPAVP
jgi:uncharacterized protein (TIGR02118 family)